jgi:hypothetical protein
MSETPSSPESGIAEALGKLSEETRLLVRAEIEAAEKEVVDKARDALPGVGLVAAASVLGVFAGASAYRFALTVLEKMMGRGSASFLAVIGFGVGSVAAANAGLQRLRQAPVPLPIETVADAGRRVADSTPS